ncbi:MAG: XdhC family protein [Gammaproteobacteria bacterium]
MTHESDLLELAAAWRCEGRRVALATVVATWGSSPRPPGSQLVADDTGRFMGSVRNVSTTLRHQLRGI